MIKNKELNKCNEMTDNDKRRVIIEKRLLRLEKMILEDIESENELKNKSLVKRFRHR